MLFHLSRRKHYHFHSFLHLLNMKRGKSFRIIFLSFKKRKKQEKKVFFRKKRFKKVFSVLDPISDNCCSADILLKMSKLEIKFQPSVNFNDCFPIQFSQIKLRRFEFDFSAKQFSFLRSYKDAHGWKSRGRSSSDFGQNPWGFNAFWNKFLGGSPILDFIFYCICTYWQVFWTFS